MRPTKDMRKLLLNTSGCQNTKPVGTPSVRTGNEESPALSSEDATAYRALVARANYLAQDRVDLGYSVKELCRKMAKPTECTEAVWKIPH